MIMQMWPINDVSIRTDILVHLLRTRFSTRVLHTFSDEVGPVQVAEGKLLQALITVCRPAVVVEFGFGRGHSARWLLGALPRHSQLYSYDISNDAKNIARRAFGKRNNFFFVQKSQADFSPADVDGRQVDLVFLDALHDLETNKLTFQRLLAALADSALVVIHDTGTWMTLPTGVSEDWEAWLSTGEYQHQRDERLFVNWLRTSHSEFAQIHLHTTDVFRHGLTVLQRSGPLQV